ncbi:UDP-3-O-acyl-N-acetylglucosamine deacetylase [Oscillatoria salina]|uniref:UDP-3-O-acyl-N-acetylglucosamine deacetylase n=1 Tax=Oscillatoria salina TaxID=331517 RepID=UPI001CCDAAA1|nr:UDP-3-O-acyl-N-acetylglucosamine deacetylase [Oscillatoria salina]MBZ8182436.1 UDP-3-O-acyl-N-acetylglucosamine deacetylase [Oscillatoria salina IIICB1]
MPSTIAKPFQISGIGLHSGKTATVRVMPATPGEGRYFVRIDLPGEPSIPALVESVNQTTLSTELAAQTATVRTVEHLLAALTGSGIDNARIEIDAGEVPLLDGSAKQWVEAIATVGILGTEDWEPQREGRGRSYLQTNPQSPIPNLQSPIWVQETDAFVAAIPAPETRFTYGIDFEIAAIGKQWYSWTPSQESFAQAIAPARTFGLASQIEKVRQAGLIKGGSLDNALVCSDTGWLNPPLRFANEPVRHKLLDLVGDLSLLGTIPVAHYLAYKASHKLHVNLAKQLRALFTTP